MRRRTRCGQASGVCGVAAGDVGHDWFLASASVMALASFGLVLVAVRIFAMFAQWCSRACAGESCVVTLVFGMHAHSECEVVRLFIHFQLNS